MTILVTGGAGYIGSHMVHMLLDAGEPVVVLDDLSAGSDWAVPPQSPLIVGDVGDQSLVRSLIAKHKIESIIHLAASISVEESTNDPLAYYRNNTMNSRDLLECAVAGGVRHFIFSSTAAVYGEPEAVPIVEEHPTVPVSPYGWSKLMTEVMLREASAAHRLDHVILRYFNVAGADPQMRTGEAGNNSTHLIKVALEAALGRRPMLEVFGTNYPTSDGTCVRDYIHVTDLVNVHSHALQHLRRGGESTTINCGYGRGFSVRQVIDAVKRVSDADFRVVEASRRAGDPVTLVASSARARQLLGWQPQFDDLDTIVAHALAWERMRAQRASPLSNPASG